MEVLNLSPHSNLHYRNYSLMVCFSWMHTQEHLTHSQNDRPFKSDIIEYITHKFSIKYNVKMTEEIDGTVSLSFHRFNESLTGVIDGIELTYNHNYNYFIGSKSVL